MRHGSSLLCGWCVRRLWILVFVVSVSARNLRRGGFVGDHHRRMRARSRPPFTPTVVRTYSPPTTNENGMERTTNTNTATTARTPRTTTTAYQYPLFAWDRRRALETITKGVTAGVSTMGWFPATTSLAVVTDARTSSPSTTASEDEDVDGTVRAPLEFVPALNAYVVYYYLFGERFGGIVDTGSPFLTAPATCSRWSYKYQWGCYQPEKTFDSGYANTVEVFDNNQGTVVWRKAPFALDTGTRGTRPTDTDTDTLALSPAPAPQDLVFGVFGPDLLDGPGGVFLGLIKETDKWIRPSFLGQTGYDSFCVDLRHGHSDSHSHTPTTLLPSGTPPQPQRPQLVLSKTPLIVGDYIPLVRDLNRRYRAPVVHYTARVARFVVNGLPLRLDDNDNDNDNKANGNRRRNRYNPKPTYVIFDTGVSGMSVSEDLFDGRYLQARKNREKSLWGTVLVGFQTHEGNEVQLTATQPLTTPLGKATPWNGFRGNLIVLGLAFLDGLAMTVDITDGKLQFSNE